MVDEKTPLTRKERQQRQKRLEQALQRRSKSGAKATRVDEVVPAGETAPEPALTEPQRGPEGQATVPTSGGHAGSGSGRLP